MRITLLTLLVFCAGGLFPAFGQSNAEKIDAREAAKAAQAALQAGEEQSTEDIMAEYEAERARKEARKGNAAGWGIL